jgi:chitinase
MPPSVSSKNFFLRFKLLFLVVLLLSSIFALWSRSAPLFAAPTGACVAPAWSSSVPNYVGGDVVTYNNQMWKAQWWTNGVPGADTAWTNSGTGTVNGQTVTLGACTASSATNTTTSGGGGGNICSAVVWVSDVMPNYNTGDVVTYNSQMWKANWWTSGTIPPAAPEWTNSGSGVVNGQAVTLGACTMPTATPTETPLPQGVSGKYVIGYFPEWGVYGRNYFAADLATYMPKLTHLQYAFINLDASGTCKLYDAWAADEKPGKAPYTQPGNLRQLKAMRDAVSPSTKLVLSVGGWTLSEYFSDVAADPSKRATMISTCMALLTKYGWDGIDIDWEYPVQGGENGNNAAYHDDADGANLVTLLSELRTALGQSKVLSLAMGAGEDKFRHIPMAQIAQYANFISPMTYDFNGAWQNETDHNAALFSNPSNPMNTLGSVRARYYSDHAIKAHINGITQANAWLDNDNDGAFDGQQIATVGGVPSTKIVLGVPFYGRAWANVNSATNQGLFQTGNNGTLTMGGICNCEPDYTELPLPIYDASTSPATFRQNCGGGSWEESVFDFDDIKAKLIPSCGFKRGWDDAAKVPYLYGGTYANNKTGWVSYDDAESMCYKARYALNNNLGGLMLWEVTQNRNMNPDSLWMAMQDYRNGTPGASAGITCNLGPTATPQPSATPTKTVTPGGPTVTPLPTATKTNTPSPVPTVSAGRRVIGYFAEWGVYGRDYHAADLAVVLQHNPNYLTHLQYAFIKLQSDGSCVFFDAWAADQKPGKAPYTQLGNLRQLKAMRDAVAPSMKLVLSVGGWTLSDQFSNIVNDATKRAKMIQTCTAMVTTYGWDGIDIDWEYPTEGGVNGNDPNMHDPTDADKVVLMMQEFRTALGPNKVLSTAVGAAENVFRHMKMDQVVQSVDFISLMTYDLNGAWQAMTDHNAGLFANPANPVVVDSTTLTGRFNTDHTVQAFLNGISQANAWLDNNNDGYYDGQQIPTVGGVPANKLVLGIPFYGRNWANVNSAVNQGLFQNGNNGTLTTTGGACACEPDYTELPAPIYSTDVQGNPQPVRACGGGSWEESVFSYDDIAGLISGCGFKRGWDDAAKVPYLYGGTYNNGKTGWVSYDDAESICYKARYALNNNLGGMMLWEMSQNRSDTASTSLWKAVLDYRNGNPGASAGITCNLNATTPTPTNTLMPTATFTPTKTNTPVPNATLTFTPTKTNMPPATATKTATPTKTNTPPPNATLTFTPTKTNMPPATATKTATPTKTNTPVPSATSRPLNKRIYLPIIQR